MREGTLKDNVLENDSAVQEVANAIGNSVEEVVPDEDDASHEYMEDLSHAVADVVRSFDIDQWVAVVYDYDGEWYPGCIQEVYKTLKMQYMSKLKYVILASFQLWRSTQCKGINCY